MSNIRRQSIISSVVVYFGFALGFVNTYLFTKEGSFTPEQYGLVNAFIAIANIMYAFAHLGSPSVIYKFYPYYKDNLSDRKNDLAAWALLVSTIGFGLVIIAGVLLKDLVVKKYVTNAPDLVKYYHLLFPFGFGLTVYSVLEAYAWQEKKSVLTNFMREVLFRILTTVLIVLFLEGLLSGFSEFILSYSLTYLLLAVILLVWLAARKNIGFHFGISKVTRRLRTKMLTLASFVWSGGLVYNVSNVFDTLVIAAVMPNGLAYAGVYSLAQHIASVIQAPQRGIISASMGPLARAWKEKDMEKIGLIYKRSSINQLVFSVAVFCLIFMNFTDGILSFSMREAYVQALPVFLFIGLMRILDMGTGVNSQIIATSVFWRFEFFTGIILLALALPLNYILTKTLGVIGPAISNLFAFTVYNVIRCGFLWKKLGLQPFSVKTPLTIVLGIVCYTVCYLLFDQFSGIVWIVVRSLVFVTLFASGTLFLKLSPDIFHVAQSVRNRIRRII